MGYMRLYRDDLGRMEKKVETIIEGQGFVVGVVQREWERKWEVLFRVWGIGFRDIIPKVENQTVNEIETGILRWFIRIRGIPEIRGSSSMIRRIRIIVFGVLEPPCFGQLPYSHLGVCLKTEAVLSLATKER